MDAAKQAPSFEKEIHPDCLSCGKPIKHPLCPKCISNGYKQWYVWRGGMFHTEDRETQ